MLLSLTTTPMDNILAQVTNITTLVGDVFSLITGNAYLCFFAAAALVGVVVKLSNISFLPPLKFYYYRAK